MNKHLTTIILALVAGVAAGAQEWRLERGVAPVKVEAAVWDMSGGEELSQHEALTLRHYGDSLVSESADGRDEYDFHARRQYPHLAMFTTPDPHADSYHDLSPYAYCAGNPIMFVDPTGENTYRVDVNGNFYLLDENDNEKDVIYNDNYEASIEVSKDFMASKQSKTETVHRYSDDSDIETDMDIFTTLDNTDELFRFLTDNTDVEWSQIISNESGKIVNRLGTSHNPNGDGSAYYISLVMIKTENSIIECNHCHNSPIQYPGQGDVVLAKLVKAKHPNATFRIIHQFYRYPDTIFDENTPYMKSELDELIVRPQGL